MSSSLIQHRKKQSQQRSQNVEVVVRIRPLSKQEEEQKVKSIVTSHTHRELILKDKKYSFERVFKPSATQIELYVNVIAPMILDVVDGYNCTAFAYGQTGTGKTFTMMGEKCNLVGNWKQDPDAGLIPRAAFHIFDELSKLSNIDINVKVSFIELYNEEIRDLLSDDENTLQMYSAPKGSVSIQGLTEISVHSGEGICKLLQRGIMKRQIAPTLMNHQSSRSHTVFSIVVNTRETTISGDDILKTGKINLVDLAGNENIARSGCKDMRAMELANINKSLLTLGRVIQALVDKSQKHVPYRDSKLTRILQDSLGGHTKTVIIATISPASNSYEVTASTLEYASRARDIKNTPTVNEKMTKHEIINSLVEEIDRLQKDLDAARSGTGFYVDKDNYQKMLDAIIAVTGENITAEELTEKKAERIKQLEDRMYCKVREFEETVVQCMKQREELEAAKATIKEQDEYLEQEKFLSKWYENQTSEKLEEAKKLLAATKNLHSEKEILLAKLEHQFTINVSNEQITQKAVGNVLKMLDQFGNEETEKFMCSENKIKNKISERIFEFKENLQKSSNTFKNISIEFESTVKDSKNALCIKNNILSKSKYYINKINEKTKIIEDIFNQHEKLIDVLNLEVPKTVEFYKKNSERVYNRANQMRELEEFSNSIVKEQHKVNSSLEQMLIEKIEGTQKEIRENQTEIEKTDAKMVKLQEKKIILEKKKISLKKKSEEYSESLKKHREDMEKREKAIEESIKERLNTLEQIVDESYKSMQHSMQLPILCKQQGNQVQELLTYLKDFDKKLKDVTSDLENKYDEITVHTLENYKKCILNTCEDVDKTLDEKVNVLLENIEIMMGKSETLDSFRNFISKVKEILNQQVLEKNIKATHAGDTPCRNSTSYPTKIKEVTPREALIKKFKDAAIKEDFSN
ncbi:kinesin-like protein KIF11-A isoform X1 [Diorhabda sublineata]|uniref:kinesin-like protein KIF11-A isoform X1 n=2 Tax=Diorhabda sublineata TaxID=1163346 RepID=UPI0024E115E1|nr:kinesin-like protein KIF11-A isoform X1 [Diorhabda sublineata]